MKRIKLSIFSFLALILVIILTACDSTKSYNISYVVDTNKTITVSYEENKLLSSAQVNADSAYDINGKTRDGWYLDSSYTNVVTFPYKVTSDATLYLKWADGVKTYTVNFYDGSTLLTSNNVTDGSFVTAYNYMKNGYNLVGWYSDEALTVAFDFNTKVTSNLNLYAKFEEITPESETYTVKYRDGSTLLKTVTVEKDATLEEYTPTKEHYTFAGWYLNSAFTEAFDYSTKITENLALYAKWTAEVYDVKYYVETTLYDTEHVNYNCYANGPESNPTKTGYVFEGWYKDAELNDKFVLSSNKITEATTLYAAFEEFSGIEVTSYAGANEGIYLILPDTIEASNYTVSYSLADKDDYTEIDEELIRAEGSTVRIDILGLTADKYDVKIEAAGATRVIQDIQTYETDRSGYAHFNYTSGVGAYNDDGTLKANTVVVYVTDATKNTVTATINGKTYTGLVSILSAQSTSKYPLCVRFLDTIKTTQFNTKTYTSKANTTAIVDEQATSLGGNYQGYTAAQIIENGWNSYSADLAKGVTTLNGLNSKVSYSKNEFDTYWNMCDVKNASNITIEGIGENAGIYQWGFTWSGCNSIEVKNLTFSDYTEDACSFQGGSTITNFKNFWVHNCTFNRGKNNWDFSKEQDKHYGDGATDFKTIAYVTSSYNRFNNCKKTGLVGGGDDQLTMGITFHHNYYNTVGSRLPLGRQANMHFYNNYYYNCSTAQDIRANAFVLSEYNYFTGCSNPQKVTVNSTYTGTVIKSFNDTLVGCGTSAATVVTDRTATLSGNCKPDGSTDYNNFDTNSNLFYYDSTNKCSNVSALTATADVPTVVPNFAGAGANYYKSILLDQVSTKYTITFMNGSSTFSTLKVVENTAAKEPTSYPTSSTGVFDCWCTDSALTTEYDWSTLVTKDITLYAKFTSNPTYSALANDANNVMAYDFNSTTSGEKLTQFTDYTTKGIFGSTNGSNYSIAYGQYTGSAVQTVDNADDAAAQINVSAGTTYTTGIVKGWVELTVSQKTGSKWALLTFIGSENATVFTIGANSSSYLSYSTGSTKIESGTAFSSDKVAVGSNYKIYYEFDLDNGTTTIIINNTVYLNKATTNVKAFSGFYTMTNGSGTGTSARVVTLDNIAIVKK